MKIFKKINIGFVLTLIVLISLIMYLAKVEEQREAEKENIVAAIEKFVEITDKYCVYPEEINNLSKKVTGEEKSKYIQEIENEISKLMIPNEESVKIQVQALENNLNFVNQEQGIRTKNSRRIIKIPSYEFDGDQVTVQLNSIVETTIKYIDEQGKEQEKQETFSSGNDEVILQKIDEEWKIVYSNLQYNQYRTYVEDMIYMY